MTKNLNRILVFLVPFVIMALLVYYFQNIAIYILLAWVLSMIAAPIMKFYSKFFGNKFSATLTLSTFTLILIALFWLFLPPILHQTKNLAGIDYKKIGESFEEPIQDWQNWLEKKGLRKKFTVLEDSLISKIHEAEKNEPKWLTKIIHLDTLFQNSNDSLSNGQSKVAVVINIDQPKPIPDKTKEVEEIKKSGNFIDNIKENIYSLLNPAKITHLFTTIIGFFGNLIIGFMSIMFISFFFISEQGLFEKMLSLFLPTKLEASVGKAVKESSEMLIRYFVGVAIQVTVITVFVSTLLTILGVKNALLIGFFAGVMNVIPYIGPIIGAAFGVMITISSNLDVSFYDVLLPMIAKVLAVFAIMQLLDNFILQPNIFSKSIKAHPLEIFIIILAGADLGGVLGMVLAIPVYTVIRVLAKVFFSEFKVVKKITEGL